MTVVTVVETGYGQFDVDVMARHGHQVQQAKIKQQRGLLVC